MCVCHVLSSANFNLHGKFSFYMQKAVATMCGMSNTCEIIFELYHSQSLFSDSNIGELANLEGEILYLRYNLLHISTF